MIHNHDRSGWFGASDTAQIMGNWNTNTFQKWWRQKLGVNRDHFETIEMQTGTAMEHRILEHIGIWKMDRQIKKRRLRLRVNLDGENRKTIFEVKTSKHPFRLTKAYWMQAQVEMFATGKELVIVSYQLEQDDYKNWFRSIDDERIDFHPVAYDKEWIFSDYLPRLKYLAQCLRKGVHPGDGAECD